MVVQDVEQLLKPVIEDMGYELWGCEYLAQGKHSLVRFYIDKADGITIDDCEQVSRQVGAILDVEDLISGEYRLEISSPGIDRPFFYPWQYQRYVGHDVQVKLYQRIDGRRRLSGKIVSATDNELELLVEGVSYRIVLSDIVKANLIVE